MNNKLAKAIFEDEVDLVNTIIKEGIDLDFIDKFGKTPLMHAIEHENIRLIELFVHLGSDINKKGSGGFTALHHAVDNSIDGTIQTGGKQGEEPLSIIKLLLEHGANLSEKDENGKTPLDFANAYESTKVTNYLITKSS